MVQKEISFAALTGGDFDSARSAEERLGWIGRDRADSWMAIGRGEVAARRPAAARAAFELSTALADRPGAWLGLAKTYQTQGDWSGAAGVYEAALASAGERGALLRGASESWLRAGQKDRALPHAQRIIELRPADATARALLDRAGGASERPRDVSP